MQVDSVVGSIGPRLRRLRQERGLSLQQLATRAEVSAAAIHKVERSDMVPTITTLLKITAALELPVGYFIDQSEGAPELVTLTRATERPELPAPHPGLALAGISSTSAHLKGSAAVATVQPGADSGGEPLSRSGEELVFVTEGVLVLDIAGRRFELGPGDSLHWLADQPHRWSNAGQEPASAIWFTLRDG